MKKITKKLNIKLKILLGKKTNLRQTIYTLKELWKTMKSIGLPSKVFQSSLGLFSFCLRLVS